MHAENLLVDDSCYRQAIEAVCERFPQLDVITPLALIIKAVDTIN